MFAKEFFDYLRSHPDEYKYTGLIKGKFLEGESQIEWGLLTFNNLKFKIWSIDNGPFKLIIASLDPYEINKVDEVTGALDGFYENEISDEDYLEFSKLPQNWE